MRIEALWFSWIILWNRIILFFTFYFCCSVVLSYWRHEKYLWSRFDNYEIWSLLDHGTSSNDAQTLKLESQRICTQTGFVEQNCCICLKSYVHHCSRCSQLRPCFHQISLMIDPIDAILKFLWAVQEHERPGLVLRRVSSLWFLLTVAKPHHLEFDLP